MDGRERFAGAHCLRLVWHFGHPARHLQFTPDAPVYDAPVYSDNQRAARPFAMDCSGYLFIDVSHGTVCTALVMADDLALELSICLLLFNEFRSCCGKLLAASCLRDLREHAGDAGLSLWARLRCSATPAGEVVPVCPFHRSRPGDCGQWGTGRAGCSAQCA